MTTVHEGMFDPTPNGVDDGVSDEPELDEGPGMDVTAQPPADEPAPETPETPESEPTPEPTPNASPEAEAEASEQPA